MIQKITGFFKNNIQKQNEINEEKKEGDKDDERVPSQIEIWMFFRKFLQLNFKTIAFKYISTLLSTYLMIRENFVLLEIRNSIINNDKVVFKYAVLEFLGMFIIRQVQRLLETLHTFGFQSKIRQEVTKSILIKIFSLDIQYFEDSKVTEISEVIKDGAEQIVDEINYNRISCKIDDFIFGGGQLYFIYCQSPYILLGMLLWTFANKVLSQIFKKKQVKKQKEISNSGDYKNFAFDDIITNINVIKTFGTEKKVIQRLNQIVEENSKLQQQLEQYQKIASIINTASQALLKITLIIQIFLGLGLSGNKLSITNSLTDLLSYSYCTSRLYEDILDLFYSSAYFEQSKKQIGKVMKLFQVKPTIYQDFNDVQTDQTRFEGDITFDNVSFKYPVSKNYLSELNQKKQDEEKQKKEEAKSSLDNTNVNASLSSLLKIDISSSEDLEPNEDLEPQESSHSFNKSKSIMREREYVIENVSLQIKKGEFVAFVGTSGSGKSTIIKLIQRFYDTNSGQILFDGKNIKDVSLNKIRRSIGLVSQEQSLFDNDIEYNITYSCENRKYTQEELRRVCEMSGVSEFVFDEKRFPKGLKTLVGTKGTKLSGGQKQRIAIARALIRKPKILILDEATSALDAESEHIVQTYIDKLVSQRGMTIITVAHRLSTILKSDKIFVMHRGQIKEQGTHNELIAKNGVYKKLVHHQINFQQKINEL